MNSAERRKVAPFVSITLLVVISLTYVFIKMEAVRGGYEVLKLGRQHKIAAQEKATLEVTYAKLTRPERLDEIGTTRLALGRAQKNQVVLMAATGQYAIRQ